MISAIANRAAMVLTRIHPGRLTVRVGLIEHLQAQFPRRLELWSMAVLLRNRFGAGLFPGPKALGLEPAQSDAGCAEGSGAGGCGRAPHGCRRLRRSG